MTSYLLATLAGAAVTLSLAPFNIWPAGLISCALLAWLMTGISPAQAAVRGWFYGLGLFGSGTSWVYVSIHVYGYASMPLAATLTVLFSAGLGLFTLITFYIYVRWVRDTTAGKLSGFAAIFVLGEWLRSWLLTGFPWLYLGYAHLHTPLAGWAPVGGVMAISFIIAYSGAYLTHSLMQKQWQRTHLALLAVLWISGWGLNQYDWVSASEKGQIKVSMVQANIPQEVKWNRDQYWPTLNLYNTMSRELWPDSDIVVWPEAAIPGYYHNARNFLKTMSDKASESGTTLITGIAYRQSGGDDKRPTVYNSVMAFGNGDGIYHKQRLVPFGEYVPLEQWLRGLIAFFDLPMSGFSSGSAKQPDLDANGLKLASSICYEVVYPDLVARATPRADVLLTISNDAWFGESIGPLQHMQMAQMRALENGRFLIRSTGNGVSAIVNHRGEITVRSEQFKRQTLSGTVTAMTGTTPFARFGSLPILIICTLIAIAGIVHKRLRG